MWIASYVVAAIVRWLSSFGLWLRKRPSRKYLVLAGYFAFSMSLVYLEHSEAGSLLPATFRIVGLIAAIAAFPFYFVALLEAKRSMEAFHEWARKHRAE